MPKLKLRYEREREGVSLKDFAVVARCGRSLLSQLELGRVRPCADSRTLRRIADALGWEGEPIELLDEVDDG